MKLESFHYNWQDIEIYQLNTVLIYNKINYLSKLNFRFHRPL